MLKSLWLVMHDDPCMRIRYESIREGAFLHPSPERFNDLQGELAKGSPSLQSETKMNANVIQL